MDDLISRQAAIDALKEHRALYCDNTPDTFSKLSYAEKSRVDELDTAIATLVNLPPAQPEPKEGHWILRESPDGGEQYECSECGVLWEFNDGTPEDNEAYFCPKCGAGMRGEQDERLNQQTGGD